jgi:hypothetical protein
MKARILIILAILAAVSAGCGGIKPAAEMLSAAYVPFINASGGVMWTFEGMDIVEIKMDFAFDPALSEGLDTGSEDYRSQIYGILVEGAHLYYQGQEMPMQYGYWPVKAGKGFANEVTLFYLVPENPASGQMRFVYDGDYLGEGGLGIDEIIEPER